MAKLLKQVVKGGKRIITVEMEHPDSVLREVNDKHFYRLGGQVDDVMPGHVLSEANRVRWCPFDQQWVE